MSFHCITLHSTGKYDRVLNCISTMLTSCFTALYMCHILSPNHCPRRWCKIILRRQESQCNSWAVQWSTTHYIPQWLFINVSLISLIHLFMYNWKCATENSFKKPYHNLGEGMSIWTPPPLKICTHNTCFLQTQGQVQWEVLGTIP